MNQIKNLMVEDYAVIAQSKIGIENHKKMAEHLGASSHYHLEAARFYEAGEYEKAKQYAIVAKGYQCLACQVQRESENKFISEN